MRVVTHRSLVKMFLLLIVTFGIYLLYWLFVTTKEFRQLGAHIPTRFLLFIPIANIYFLYRFAQGFCTYILENESQTIAYFFLLILLMPAAMFIYQSHMNKRVTLATP